MTSCLYLVDDRRLEVDEERARDELSGVVAREEGLRIRDVLFRRRLDARSGRVDSEAVRLYAVLETVELPTFAAHLDTGCSRGGLGFLKRVMKPCPT